MISLYLVFWNLMMMVSSTNFASFIMLGRLMSFFRFWKCFVLFFKKKILLHFLTSLFFSFGGGCKCWPLDSTFHLIPCLFFLDVLGGLFVWFFYFVIWLIVNYPSRKSCYCLVTKSCSVLFWPHGLCNLPGSSVHGILQARILE